MCFWFEDLCNAMQEIRLAVWMNCAEKKFQSNVKEMRGKSLGEKPVGNRGLILNTKFHSKTLAQ